MRRYLPTLCLYDGDRDRTAELQRTYGSGSGGGGDTNEDGSRVESITATNVAAALTSLAQDLNAVLSDPTSFQEKVTIEADRLLIHAVRELNVRLNVFLKAYQIPGLHENLCFLARLHFLMHQYNKHVPVSMTPIRFGVDCKIHCNCFLTVCRTQHPVAVSCASCAT